MGKRDFREILFQAWLNGLERFQMIGAWPSFWPLFLGLTWPGTLELETKKSKTVTEPSLTGCKILDIGWRCCYFERTRQPAHFYLSIGYVD